MVKKIFVAELGRYSELTSKELLNLVKNYDDWSIKEYENACGCWDSCKCPDYKLGLFGHRQETKEEKLERELAEKKHSEDQLKNQEILKQQEIALLKRLREQYPNA